MSKALHHLGLPIIQGSVSTILGVTALIAAPSYIFVTFFKIVFMVMLFGALHGLLLLPVLLSIFGPGSCHKSKKEEQTPVQVLAPRYFNGFDHPNRSILAFSSMPPAGKLTSAQRRGMLMDPTMLMRNGGKPYDTSDKDLGLGTSGEDSSESSFGPNGQKSNANSPKNNNKTQNHQQRSQSMKEEKKSRRRPSVEIAVLPVAGPYWNRYARATAPYYNPARMHSYHENPTFVSDRPSR
jgi:hypothetical protein